MEKEILEKVEKWLDSNIDSETKQAIQDLKKDEEQLTEAFYKNLEFGTGGLRGIMGVGSNRINKYTIGMATQGLSNYLKKAFPNEKISVAIAHDSRNNSSLFAKTTADVFSANGIKVYFFEALRPTPELSFAIRHFGCKSGVVLTASHNPKEYNGYKAYWDDGGQVIAPHDKNIIEEVNKIASIDQINFERNESLITLIGKEVDDVYVDKILSLSLSKEAVKRQKDLKIVFSPIHGTGITLVPQTLKKMGFEQVTVVKEQSEPHGNGNFPTVVYPNPEEAEAMKMGLELAKSMDADLLMATDPDADRVGIAAKNHHGQWQLLNGNQTGSLLIYYLLTRWSENGKINGNQYVCKTIVTSDIIHKIASHFKVESYDTLTGFKFIAALLKANEGKKEFIGGGEESYGYLIGDFVRDKDAIASCAVVAEMVAYAKDQGKSLFDLLFEMYKAFGVYRESLISITKKGRSGASEIAAIMQGFRSNPPTVIAGSKVKLLLDYKTLEQHHLIDGLKTKLDYPSSNVLQFILEDGTKISARPSGTEPKIKFYFSVNTAFDESKGFDHVYEALGEKIESIKADLKL